jgi:hypothetical protein
MVAGEMIVQGTGFQWLPTIAAAVAAAIWFGRLLWARARDRVRARAGESWPTAEARIESFYIVRNTSNRRYSGGFYLPVLQYSYTVQDERCSGEFNLGVFEADRDSANEVGKKWVGENIRIRYKPSSPQESIWLEQDGAPPRLRSSAPDGVDDSMIDPELNH